MIFSLKSLISQTGQKKVGKREYIIMRIIKVLKVKTIFLAFK